MEIKAVFNQTQRIKIKNDAVTTSEIVGFGMDEHREKTLK